MRVAWSPLIKLTIYTSTISMMTVLLALIITNARSGPTESYSALFSDASGVTSNDNVKIAGVAVGRVTGVEVVGHGVAKVSFDVESDVVVPADVRVVVRYENLVGDRYLQLVRSSNAAARLAGGSTIPQSRTSPAVNLTVLFGGFQPLFQALEPNQVNELADEILRTLQGEGGTISALLEHTASLTSTLADHDAIIGSLITGLDGVMGTVASRDRQLSDLLVQLQRSVSGLSANRGAIGSAISSMSTLTQSVAGLLVDVRPSLRADIAGLGALASNLNKGSGTIARQLKDLPILLNGIDRTASYGSWFQFYLCDLAGSFTLPGLGETSLKAYSNAAARCSR